MRTAAGAVSLLAVVALASVLAAARPVVSQESGKKEQRTAIVDMARILMECPKAREADEWHRRETGKLRAALRTRANLHAQARADMELLVAGTEEYEKRLEDLDAEAWKIDYDGKRGRQRIERGRTALLRALHVRMLSVVGNLARKRGYELVATKNDGLIEMMRLETMDQFLAMVATQAVLYGDKSLDITDEVLKELLN